MGHYVNFEWPPLDNITSVLFITKIFFGNRHPIQYLRVLKREMSLLHKLYFCVVQKIITPRKDRVTIVSYLDLKIIELVHTKVKIDLPSLIIKHMHHVLLNDEKGHALTNRFQLNHIFEGYLVQF